MSTIILQEQAPCKANRWKSAHFLLKPSLSSSIEHRPTLKHLFLRGQLDASLQLRLLKWREDLPEPRYFHTTIHMFMWRPRPPPPGTPRFPCRGEWLCGVGVGAGGQGGPFIHRGGGNKSAVKIKTPSQRNPNTAPHHHQHPPPPTVGMWFPLHTHTLRLRHYEISL